MKCIPPAILFLFKYGNGFCFPSRFEAFSLFISGREDHRLEANSGLKLGSEQRGLFEAPHAAHHIIHQIIYNVDVSKKLLQRD